MVCITFEKINKCVLKINLDMKFKQIKLIKFESIDEMYFNRSIYNFEYSVLEDSFLINIHNGNVNCNIELDIVILQIDNKECCYFSQLLLTTDTTNTTDTNFVQTNTVIKNDECNDELVNEKLEMFNKMGENVVKLFSIAQKEQMDDNVIIKIKNENDLNFKVKKKNGN